MPKKINLWKTNFALAWFEWQAGFSDSQKSPSTSLCGFPSQMYVRGHHQRNSLNFELSPTVFSPFYYRWILNFPCQMASHARNLIRPRDVTNVVTSFDFSLAQYPLLKSNVLYIWEPDNFGNMSSGEIIGSRSKTVILFNSLKFTHTL